MVKNGNKVLKTEAVVPLSLKPDQACGVDPELLPGEMELCEKFKVSRVTVRRAIESLIAGAYIIRLPKRRGAFTNPEMAKSIPYLSESRWIWDTLFPSTVPQPWRSAAS